MDVRHLCGYSHPFGWALELLSTDRTTGMELDLEVSTA